MDIQILTKEQADAFAQREVATNLFVLLPCSPEHEEISRDYEQ